MNWRQWDIGSFEFPAPVGEHPVVIISNPDRAARAKLVNVLYCTTQRQSRPAGPDEVLLNSADGLDWESYCRCDHIFSVERDRLRMRAKPARVSAQRQRQIASRLIELFKLQSFDSR
jgi:mRNA-degrading endonuclease toxin of MazEF toxin-antitoxin module